MSFSIQTNVNSLIAQENLRVNSNFQSLTIQRLTSGFRINSSGDDAAGLAIANKFRSDVAELLQGVRNANDGVSQLQIIDGGLNNISKMLDRMKTLATQSASTTFTGSRTTLQAEYDSLRTEINRQAANVGLGTGTVEAARFNAAVSIYTGGGAGQSNASVSIDLSLSTDKVDATTLGLSGNIDGTSTSTTLVAGSFNGAAKFLDLGTNQVFHFKTADRSVDVRVQGDGDGLTGAEIVQQLNSGLVGTGIAVSTDSTGNIVGSSPNAFIMTVDAKAGAGTQVSAAVLDAAAKVNAGVNVFKGGALSAVVGGAGGDSGVLTFTEGANSYRVTITDADTKDTVYANLQAALKDSSLKLIRSGDNVYIMSSKTFTGAYADATGTTTGGLANLSGGTAWNVANYTAGTAPADVTTNAKTALTQLGAAVSSLGTVQGKVGAGQSMLSYAISLAQSQISNFSAAESRIRDADIAAEAANLTKAQVLQQASMAAMAQANSAPQAILSLLRG